MDVTALVPFFSTEADAKTAAVVVKAFEAGIMSKVGTQIVHTSGDQDKGSGVKDSGVKLNAKEQTVCHCDLHSSFDDLRAQVSKLFNESQVRLLEVPKCDTSSGCKLPCPNTREYTDDNLNSPYLL
jgi:hypothetical protein